MKCSMDNGSNLARKITWPTLALTLILTGCSGGIEVPQVGRESRVHEHMVIEIVNGTGASEVLIEFVALSPGEVEEQRRVDLTLPGYVNLM